MHSKYFWPASKLTESDMELLYLTRESSPNRTPISTLIAEAVRAQYGGRTVRTQSIEPNTREKEAA